jgi:hypothetical protein
VISETDAGNPQPDPTEVLRAMLKISPEDAETVRERTPGTRPDKLKQDGPVGSYGTYEGPQEISYTDIAVGDMLVIPEFFGNQYPVLVEEVRELNAVGGPVIVVQYSHGAKARQSEEVHIPVALAITRLGSTRQ